MEQDKDLRKILDETADWLSELPEHEIRQRLPEMRIPRNVDFIWNIGGTEYTVVSHFNQSAKEDAFHKLSRMMESEVFD